MGHRQDGAFDVPGELAERRKPQLDACVARVAHLRPRLDPILQRVPGQGGEGQEVMQGGCQHRAGGGGVGKRWLDGWGRGGWVRVGWMAGGRHLADQDE